jgi:hypothetical protein
MKRIILMTSLSGLIHLSFGQTKSETKLSSLAKFDVGLQGIGFTYEPKISDKIIIDLSGGAGGGYDISEGSITYDVLKPAFYFSLAPKYFYNIQSRIKKGKKTQLNSGNYIGVRIKYVTPLDQKTALIRNSILTNVHWGIQRSLGYHWLFNSHIGVGYAQDIDYRFGTIYPSLDFIFSYIILKSNRGIPRYHIND